MKFFLLCVFATLALVQAIDIWSKIKPKPANPSFVKSIYEAVKANQRITGGVEAIEGQFPFQVALLIEFLDGTFFCGGTLISKNYVLTAAHCVDGSLNSVAVLGAHNIRLEEPNQVRVKVEEFHVHEAYNNELIENDIAVLKLSDPAPLNERIQLVTLPTYSDASTTFAGAAAVAVGWGQIADSIPGINNVLRYVESNIITNTLCNVSYVGAIQGSNICLHGDEGKSTCSGDSGGPLLAKGKQVGITSFGISLGCEFGWPSVFARVTSYLDWIGAHTDVQIQP